MIGDYKLMRHLNSGEIKLFNLKTDYREEHDLASEMPEKVATMDALRRKYLEEVDGGTVEQVRQALIDKMDAFSQKSREGFAKKLAQLTEESPPDLEARKKALLKELNQKLIKNEVNKEKSRRYVSSESWRESPPKDAAEKAVRDRWVDVIE
jgi:hypothetical protein